MSDSKYECEICGKELVYGGRGRPPKRCDEHKGVALPDGSSKPQSKGESEVPVPRKRPGSSQPAPAARPRPGSKSDNGKSDQKATLPASGTPDTGSRAKAESAARRANVQAEMVDGDGHPRGSNGTPMAKIVFAASELVPTGQYANVSVGPAQIHLYIDLDRSVSDDEAYLNERERSILVKSLNELAEVVEAEVIAVQRNIVLESLQTQESHE